MSMAMSRRRARLGSLLAAQAVAASPPDGAKLDIAELRLYPVREPVSGRSYVILRAKTRSGLTGYGECVQASKEDLAIAQQFWAGRPATSYVQSQPDSPLAGAIDMALLDIAGKACQAPIYRVLGGPTRNKARVFTSLGGENLDEKIKALNLAESAGYRCFGVRVPPPAARNQGKAYELEVRHLAEAVRSKGGDFVLEGAELLTPGDAASVATTMEALHPLWFDEPCSIANLHTIRKIADESVVSLGFGRDVRAAGGFQDLLSNGLIDVVRPDLLRFGITGARRIAAMAETYYVAVAPRHEGSPIASAVALHVAASLPNFSIQHVPLPAAELDRAMRAELLSGDLERASNGFASLPTGPGLGIKVNEAALEKYYAA